MRLLIASSALLLSTLFASASGGISCSGEGGPLTLELEGGVTRGMGGPLFSFSGTVTIDDKSVADDLRKTSFELKNVPQYWLDGKVLNLLLYKERGEDKPHGYVEVEMRTESAGPGTDDEGTYAGTFTVKTFDVVSDDTAEPREFTASAPVSCFGE